MKIALDTGAYEPEKAHESDAGYDLRTPKDWMILPGESTVIYTGVHMAIPKGYFGKLESKSGLMTKHDVICEGGVIDSGYTGGIAVKLRNNGKEAYRFKAGDKIVQLIIQPCMSLKMEVVSKLDGTERGDGGFGSTGR